MLQYFTCALRPECYELTKVTPEHFNIDFSLLEEGIYYYMVDVVEKFSNDLLRCDEYRLSKSGDTLFIDALAKGVLISKSCFKNFTKLSDNQYMR